MSSRLLRALGCALPLLCLVQHAEADNLRWPGHLQLGAQWIKQVAPANNRYESPPQVSYDAQQQLHVSSKCASFLTLMLQHAYPDIIDAHALYTLFGSTSPEAAQWYDALPHGLGPAAGISFVALDANLKTPSARHLRNGKTLLLAAGDVLVSKYTEGTISGHVMSVNSIKAPTVDQVIALSGTQAIPGVKLVRRWVVEIIDSSATPHGTNDTRFQHDAKESDGNDHGIGRGTILLYEDATPGGAHEGEVVGWAWSEQSSYTYQFSQPNAVDNKGKTTYRPLRIGRFAGAGL